MFSQTTFDAVNQFFDGHLNFNFHFIELEVRET